MWVPKAVIGWFEVAKDTVTALREDNAALRAEVEVLRRQVETANIMSDWLRIKVNQLEFERTALIERAYQIKLPVPELSRKPLIDPMFDPRNFAGFDDVGDDLAKQLGLET